ncbi:hypothetical protein [Halobacillus halophilus]|uniref:hypothetical protein n=1 Tax=Halobacillus halophilus TaxID=1570 RepID=UPI001CD4BC8C|nr:hypothetical protein [Halobacillus halophilus]MCA1011791.1 hypothetical protein [Halobacillus halophilus]
MPELETGQGMRKHLSAAQHRIFAEMFDKDRFVDGIPLDELSKHVRKSKSYKKTTKRMK